jgi:phosphoglucomutase
VKFGFADGSVIGGEDADAMRELFRQTAHDYDTVDTVVSLIHGAGSVASVYGEIENEKQKAFEVYLRFIRRVVAGEDGRLLSAMRTAEGIGLVVDFNGSARTVSVDSEFLTDLGVEVRAVNDAPREIVHQIVPEGAGLETCRRVLEDSHEQDSKYTLGYVPDNDGDRGNLVYIDEQGHAAKLHAQETFALACVAELSWLVYSGELTFSADGRAEQKVAIVVNGPTSMRVDRIAAAFDAHVYRAEVGEANVVGLARNLRSRGFLVPILGEGSNGGNITHPSTVRDPLATVGAALKLLVAPKRAGRQSPFDIWLSRRDAGSAERFDRSLPGILRSLPRFATTSAFESRASLQIRTSDHGSLKSEYERIFKKQWAARKSELADRLGVRSFVVINYEGTGETHGMGSAYRSGSQRGGFKILFKDEIGRPTAFLWMRGSGTEPVFRIMADVEGEAPEKEEYLLDWHVEMIRQADRAAGT